jgi:hypothetical protein
MNKAKTKAQVQVLLLLLFVLPSAAYSLVVNPSLVYEE